MTKRRGYCYDQQLYQSKYKTDSATDFFMKDCVSMRERLSARTAERALHRNAVNSTSCDGGALRVLLTLPKTLKNADTIHKHCKTGCRVFASPELGETTQTCCLSTYNYIERGLRLFFLYRQYQFQKLAITTTGYSNRSHGKVSNR
jgi:hypothetical protein